MIVIVLRSSRTCHNMNVRPGEIISRLHCLPNMTSSIPGLSGDVHDSIQNDLDFDPSQGGSKSGHFDPILGGWCYTKQCKFWRVSSVLIQGDSHFSGFRGGQNRPFWGTPGKGQNRLKSDDFDPPVWTLPDTRFYGIPTDLWQSHEDDNG